MIALPRHVIPKKLASGAIAYYYNVPTKYRELRCPLSNEPLGTDFGQMKVRAEVLNGQFDEWDRTRKGVPVTGGAIMPKYGTVDWLFREYKISDAYREKVAQRSRSDYEWAMEQICDIKTKTGDRVGDRHVRSITPRAADKLYKAFIVAKGKKLEPGKLRLRTGEKLVGLCRKACV
jgi:hypothetical protein